MIKIIGVRFRRAGKVYYFSPGSLMVEKGQHVIVETARGVEYGTVVIGVSEVADDEVTQPLKQVIRISTREDDQAEVRNREKEAKAMAICKERIRAHDLKMKLIGVEYTFDNTKLLFYFTADGRVDFRELVKDLASTFRTRIELRQVGVRDETKMCGGIGICGRELCCHSYLSDFVPVSIKMAKEQNLSLNPTKISGICGRLMCCLANEEEVYEEQNAKMPRVGEVVTTPEGLKGSVTSINIFKETVKVLVTVTEGNENQDEERELREYSAKELKYKQRRPRREERRDSEDGAEGGGNGGREKKEREGRRDRKDRRDKKPRNEEEELEFLEELEQTEQHSKIDDE